MNVAAADWKFRDAAELSEAELTAALEDPDWRLRHLYWIIDKDKNRVLFRPNEVQRAFLQHLWFRNIVLKARQRGYSTLIQLMMLDACLFTKDTRAAVIAHELEAATRIFRDKIKFAYDNLPPLVRAMYPLTTDSKSELMLANNSSLQVSTSVRSGTLHWLHVSEFGKICAKYPLRAHEIQTGSLPAVPQTGIIVVESTAEGQEGAFHDMVMQAQAHAESGKKLAKLDWRFHFASWWDAAEYEMDPALAIVTPVDHAYFDRVEGEIGRPINAAKQAWYVTTRSSQFAGDRQLMFQEYPSTPQEAFEQSTEGAYLADQLAQARREGRITKVPYDPAFPVNTWWDLGLNDLNAIWFHQRVGLRDHWINYIEGAGEPYAYYRRKALDTGYVLGKTYLPHDGAHRRPGAEVIKTSADMIEEVGFRDIEIVPRIDELGAGIQQLRNDFVHYWFDETNCALGLGRLANYRKAWNERLGAWTDKPRMDDNRNGADAIRQKAQWYAAGLHNVSGKPHRRNRSGMAA